MGFSGVGCTYPTKTHWDKSLTLDDLSVHIYGHMHIALLSQRQASQHTWWVVLSTSLPTSMNSMHTQWKGKIKEKVSEIRTVQPVGKSPSPRNGCALYEPRRAGTFTQLPCAHCRMTCCAYIGIRDMLCTHWHSCSPLFGVFPHRNIAFSLDSGLAQNSILKRGAKVEPKLHLDLFKIFCTKDSKPPGSTKEKSAECH